LALKDAMIGIIVLIVVLVLWFIILPPIAVVLWILARTVVFCLRFDDAEVPYWLDTPWDMLTHGAVAFFCVRVQDCDGQHSVILPGIRNMRCAVMANHRSFGDFFVDPAMADCAVMARIAAVAVTCIAGCIGLAWNRIIMVNRGQDSRQMIFERSERHERYLFYPEGTRRASHPDADEPVALKPGGIKNVYEGNRPVLINICVNKERIVNEKKGWVSWGVVLYRARAGPIDPADYKSFDAFLKAVEQAWGDAWRRAYNERDTCETGQGSNREAPAHGSDPLSSDRDAHSDTEAYSGVQLLSPRGTAPSAAPFGPYSGLQLLSPKCGTTSLW
jgi:1-acyl-sn-glycerol-3-phosphate acyltransferase